MATVQYRLAKFAFALAVLFLAFAFTAHAQESVPSAQENATTAEDTDNGTAPATNNIITSAMKNVLPTDQMIQSDIIDDPDVAEPAMAFDNSEVRPECDDSILAALNSKTHYFHEGQSDEEIARQRAGLRQRLIKIFDGNPLEEKNDDTPGIRQLKILMQKNEFSTWFRSYDESNKNLDMPLNHRDMLVKTLPDPQKAFIAKLEAIRNAKYTVDIAMFIFGRDEASYAILKELKDALHRGVNVRILEDSIGSFTNSLHGNPHFKALMDYARDNAGFVTDPTTGQPSTIKARAEIVVFNPVSNFVAFFRGIFNRISNVIRHIFVGKNSRQWEETLWNPFRRMHDKLLLIDAEFPELALAITGGRNINNEYFDLYKLDPSTMQNLNKPDDRNFEDFEVMIRNSKNAIESKEPNRSVGIIVAQEFDRLYFNKANRRITEGLIGVLFGREKYFEKMEGGAAEVDLETGKAQDEMGVNEYDPNFGKHDLACGFFEQSVDFANTANNITHSREHAIRNALKVPKAPLDIMSYKDPQNRQSILARISRYLFKEDKEITIVSPYLCLGPRDIQALHYWLKQDSRRHLTLITGSVLTSDSIFSLALMEVAVVPMLLSNEDLNNQISVYEYGKCDDRSYGGKKLYDKMHTKMALFKSQNVSLSTSYNKDPLSQFSNSEFGAFIDGAQTAEVTQAKIDQLKADSVLYGSDEYMCLRTSPNAPRKIKHRVKMQKALFWLIDKLGLWKLA